MQPQNANSGVQLTFSSLADEKIKELQAIIDGITEPLILIDQNFDIKRVNQATLSFTNEAGYRDLTKQKCYTKLYGRENICPYCPFLSHKMENSDFSDVFDLKSFPIPELKREVLFKYDGKNQNLNLSFFHSSTRTEPFILSLKKLVTSQRSKKRKKKIFA